jgi:hypothetical protein
MQKKKQIRSKEEANTPKPIKRQDLQKAFFKQNSKC